MPECRPHAECGCRDTEAAFSCTSRSERRRAGSLSGETAAGAPCAIEWQTVRQHYCRASTEDTYATGTALALRNSSMLKCSSSSIGAFASTVTPLSNVAVAVRASVCLHWLQCTSSHSPKPLFAVLPCSAGLPFVASPALLRVPAIARVHRKGGSVGSTRFKLF